jgi:N-acetylmuramoyl-L-alanine amidase
MHVAQPTPRTLASQSAAPKALAQEQEPPPPESAPQQVPAGPLATPPAPRSAPSGPLIVLDPAHGGSDPGARSESGVIERDIVLRMAHGVRAELEREGYRVILTRNDDSNPSYDDRAAIANAYRDAIFVTLHISSTGASNTVRAYFAQFGTAIPPSSAGSDTNEVHSGSSPGLTPWQEAQRPSVNASHRLADLVQRELAKFFPGSPADASPAAVRGLRSIAGPAIAVEISSVSASDPNSLTAAAVPIANAIGRGGAAFRQSDTMGAK